MEKSAKTLREAIKEKVENFRKMIEEITLDKTKINQFAELSAEQMVLFVNKNILPYFSRGDLDTPASELFTLLLLDKHSFPIQYKKTRRYLEYFAKQVEFCNQP